MKIRDIYIFLFILFTSFKVFAQEFLRWDILSPHHDILLCCPDKDSTFSFYKNGKIGGKYEDSTFSAFFENGQLSYKYFFKNGGVWNMEAYEENGTPIFFGTLKDGNGTLENQVALSFNGKKAIRVKSIGYYLNGKPDGKWQAYSDSKGKFLWQEFIYKNGELVSNIQYDKKGKKSREEFYSEKFKQKDNEQPILTSSKYYKKGILESEATYNEKQKPTNIKYYKKGVLKAESNIEYPGGRKPPKRTEIVY